MIDNGDLPRNPNAAEVGPLLDSVHDWQGQEGITDATELAAVLDAHAQATLAVAYEARTANLIAFYDLGPEAGDGRDTWVELRQTIAGRLGVGVTR